MSPRPEDIPSLTDHYFTRTKEIVSRFGDRVVTYAVFMRRPVIFAPRLAVDWLNEVARSRAAHFDIDPYHAEGDWVGAGEVLVTVSGSMRELVDLETLYLQKLGPPCVAAYNAFIMCKDLPRVAFLAMDARHCAGTDMAEMMAYAASVGSAAARREADAIGFIGNATPATAHFFDTDRALGTMPHALIGYAGSTVRAAEMFVETFPDEPLIVLVDYFGREITDALAVCRRFPEHAAKGRLSFRLDTPGSRYIEGLGPNESYAVLERRALPAIRDYRTEEELHHLVGPGVSAAAVWQLRERLDEAGFKEVRIVASSGFGPAKCRAMGLANAPIDMIGTGSFLPESWAETYATADIIEYDGKPVVKAGREFLVRKREARLARQSEGATKRPASAAKAKAAKGKAE
ncbi:MAG: nicotinate phosphoribosyltransferase [Alphaproteobacteria bacterium]